MEAGRRHKTPGSETKDCIIHSTAGNTGAMVVSPPHPEGQRRWRRRPEGSHRSAALRLSHGCGTCALGTCCFITSSSWDFSLSQRDMISSFKVARHNHNPKGWPKSTSGPPSKARRTRETRGGASPSNLCVLLDLDDCPDGLHGPNNSSTGSPLYSSCHGLQKQCITPFIGKVLWNTP